MKRIYVVLISMAILSLVMLSYAQIATVDGVGGVPTADPTFTTSFTTVETALVAIKASGLNIAGQTCTIQITAANATAESTTVSQDLDTDCNLIIDGEVTGSAYGGTLAVLRLTGSDALGSPAGPEGLAIEMKTGTIITLRDLILIPTNSAPAGAYNFRMVQAFNSIAGSTTSANFERVYFTARRVSDNTPVTNPFVHAPSADTKAARIAELCAFDGGGGNNAFVIQNLVAPSGGAMLTFNFTNCVFTHLGLMAAAASRGGGISMARTAELTVNINEGCIFSFNDGSGIRGVGTLANATTALNVNGTAMNPVFFYKNGWMEDSVNTARNEGIQNDSSPIIINHAYFIGNYQESIDKLGLGPLNISDSYFANNGSDLDTTIGTPPDVVNAGNLKVTGNTGNISLTNCTIYNNLEPTNDSALSWTSTLVGGTTLGLSNVVIAGAGDQVYLNAATGPSIYNETNVALVQAGADSLESPFITVGANITPTVLYRVTADPVFQSTVFAPTWNGLGVLPGNLITYLAVNTGAYNGNREPGASDVLGANPNGVVPITDWVLY